MPQSHGQEPGEQNRSPFGGKLQTAFSTEDDRGKLASWWETSVDQIAERMRKYYLFSDALSVILTSHFLSDGILE